MPDFSNGASSPEPTYAVTHNSLRALQFSVKRLSRDYSIASLLATRANSSAQVTTVHDLSNSVVSEIEHLKELLAVIEIGGLHHE